jgi:hypothetical protein
MEKYAYQHSGTWAVGAPSISDHLIIKIRSGSKNDLYVIEEFDHDDFLAWVLQSRKIYERLDPDECEKIELSDWDENEVLKALKKFDVHVEKIAVSDVV